MEAAVPEEKIDGLTAPPLLPVLDIRPQGLGFMAVLSDKMIDELMKEHFDEKDLCNLSLVSRVMYIFAEEEELWKLLCIKKWKADFVWKGSWKRTTIMPKDVFPTEPYKKINVTGFYSDFLYNRWYRSHVPMSHWGELPSDLPPEKLVERRSNLSLEEFVEEYMKKNKPVILTDVVTKWPAWLNKWWTKESLIKRCGDVKFRISEPDPDTGKKMMIKLSTYFDYSSTASDLDPLYIFDPYFGDNCPRLLSEYEVPEYFQEDYLTLLNEDRPSYRWVVIGMPRSGTAYHLDPFRTSAWNALLVGRKRWALYPPGPPPPGVESDVDDDGSPKYSGLDPIDWYLDHYPHIRRLGHPYLQPIECIQEEGDMIFVPSNWWHMVWNLTDTVAVTQNFCDRYIFPAVYEDMKWTSSYYFEHIYWTEQMLRFWPEVMNTALIHPAYWTRHDYVQHHKTKKQQKKIRKEHIAQREQLEAWLAGMQNEEMKNALREKFKTEEEEKQKESADIAIDIVEGKEEKEANQKIFSSPLFWRAPIADVDEDEIFELKFGEKPKIHIPSRAEEKEIEERNKSFSDWAFWRSPIAEVEEPLL